MFWFNQITIKIQTYSLVGRGMGNDFRDREPHHDMGNRWRDAPSPSRESPAGGKFFINYTLVLIVLGQDHIN